ncbi:Glyoxylase, beta-lactamase superfamily II [Thermoactinomyces sp. DSM 45891]|uniref:MBL fold metallo-hydrolase n=1 Tax=Thermoactinomyces sp. DSM 45891 TaxID=1761907 RepID=UPI000921F232|nr:MBL fold metallo-hydrolase [Thermoactinomyces sp. DSM 45891]SFX42232.1 Glyoxylase, beta-lactamase superfamily II [Thermoactinomyces sp. DSM 45891]
MLNRWEDIVEVPLPLPFALKEIKAYLFMGENGVTIVDTGLNIEQDFMVWESTMKELGITWDDLDKIVLTHYHPDHYGLAGRIQQLAGGIPVYISQVDYQQAQLFWDRDSKMAQDLASAFRRHGLDESVVRQIPEHLSSFIPWIEPHPNPTFLRAGSKIQLGDRTYKVIHTPGHADGHLSFYDPEREWLIGGDFLLPRITPNISMWPNCDKNPLQSYLKTLEKMELLPVKRVYSSHGPIFENYQERIKQIRHHHESRLKRMQDFVETEGRVSATDVCDHIFGKDLSIHNIRFALSETLAHLEYLRNNQQVEVERTGKRYFYVPFRQ